MKAIFIRGGASTGIKKTYEKVNALSLRYFKQMKYRSIPLYLRTFFLSLSFSMRPRLCSDVSKLCRQKATQLLEKEIGQKAKI